MDSNQRTNERRKALLLRLCERKLSRAREREEINGECVISWLISQRPGRLSVRALEIAREYLGSRNN